MAESFRNAFVLTGPTGAGKTGLALKLAKALDAEIIGMDSMTLYRGMNIGTAKPTQAELSCVPHHLLSVLEPWESANVSWWLAQATECVREIEARGKKALFVGGTPLYLKALLCGLFDGPHIDPAIRRQLEAEAARVGSGELHARLAQVDPVTAYRLHPNDLRRVIRALEIWEATHQPISAWQQQWSSNGAKQHRTIRCCWIDRPRQELYDLLNARVQRMIAAGWIDEAAALRQLPRALSREAGQALGYRELFAYLDGQRDLSATIELVQKRSRQFAKRQLTWFRNMSVCRRVPIAGETESLSPILEALA